MWCDLVDRITFSRSVICQSCLGVKLEIIVQNRLDVSRPTENASLHGLCCELFAPRIPRTNSSPKTDNLLEFMEERRLQVSNFYHCAMAIRSLRSTIVPFIVAQSVVEIQNAFNGLANRILVHEAKPPPCCTASSLRRLTESRPPPDEQPVATAGGIETTCRSQRPSSSRGRSSAENMKRAINSRALLALVCLTVHTASSQSFSVEQTHRSRTGALKGHALQRTLLQGSPSSKPAAIIRDGQPLQTIGQIAVNKTVTVDRFCLIAARIVRPGNTYNDPSSLILEDVFECCFACDDDDRCATWTYDRATGACALKDSVSEPFSTSAPGEQERFVSSGGADIEGGFAITYKFYANGTKDFVGAATTDARAPVRLNECVKESGAAYPRGNILRVTTTASHNACCELCRNAQECFSWYRNASTRRCVLNRNVPSKVRRGGNYAGGTVI